MRLIALPIVFFLMCCVVPLCPAQAKPGDKTISIVVTDKVTGESIGGATVILRSQNAAPVQSHTDDFGQCALTVPAGVIDYLAIAVKEDGYSEQAVQWRNLPSNQGLPAELDFSLEPGVSIGGKVVDDTGIPVADADVHLITAGGKNGIISIGIDAHAKSDESGKWVLKNTPSHLSDDANLCYNISCSGFFNDRIFRGAPAYSKLRDRSAVLIIQHTFDLKGRVLDPLGQPVAGATIKAGGNGWYWFSHARTDAGGNFILPGLRPGPFEFAVGSKNFEPDMVHLTLPATMPVEVRLRAGHPLRLHVVDQSGNPISDARISVYRWLDESILDYRFYSDSSGNAIWSNAPQDDITYNITAPAMGQITGRALSPTTKPITITLGPKTQIRGTVVDAGSGQAIKDFHVITGIGWTGDQIGWETGIDGGPREILAGHNGEFDYSIPNDLVYPAYAVRVEADGYLPMQSRPFSNDEGRLSLNFRLSKGRPIAGIVYSPDHKPVSGVDVYLVEEGQWLQIRDGKVADPEVQTSRTDARGNFSFPPKIDAVDLVCLNNTGFAELKIASRNQPLVTEKSASRKFPASSVNQAKSYDLSLQPWSKVQGTFMVGSKVGANLTISLSTPTGTFQTDQPHVRLNYQAKTNSAGQFEIMRVAPGSFQFYRTIDTQNGGRCCSIYSPISIKPGQKLNVRLGGAGRAVIGRFVLPPSLNKHSLMSWFPFIAKHQDHVISEFSQDQAYAVVIKPDGRFRADDVPAGTYDVSAKFYPESILQSHDRWIPVASAYKQFTIPPMPGGRSDKPLDLGTIPVTLDKK